MQQERNISRRILSATDGEVWEQIELELGPLGRSRNRSRHNKKTAQRRKEAEQLADDHLRQRLATEIDVARIRGDSTIRVPPEIAERVFAAVVGICRESDAGLDVGVLDQSVLKETERLLRKLGTRIRIDKARLGHRPHQNWFLRNAQEEACRRLKQRQRELMDKGLDGGPPLSYYDAQWQAAEEVAPDYYVNGTTLISWQANPGRRSRRK